jgi:hypothetical protein
VGVGSGDRSTEMDLVPARPRRRPMPVTTAPTRPRIGNASSAPIMTKKRNPAMRSSWYCQAEESEGHSRTRLITKPTIDKPTSSRPVIVRAAPRALTPP